MHSHCRVSSVPLTRLPLRPATRLEPNTFSAKSSLPLLPRAAGLSPETAIVPPGLAAALLQGLRSDRPSCYTPPNTSHQARQPHCVQRAPPIMCSSPLPLPPPSPYITFAARSPVIITVRHLVQHRTLQAPHQPPRSPFSPRHSQSHLRRHAPCGAQAQLADRCAQRDCRRACSWVC